jgi:hypothetical protein
MPSIEIVSLNSDNISINQDAFEIAFIVEKKLQGHRGLFDNYLSDKKGLIIHIGNPEFRKDKEGAFFAGAIIDWDFESNDIAIPNFELNETGANQDFKFKFILDYQIDVGNLINQSLINSPDKIAYFMTDYQFGPEKIEFKNLKLDDFWRIHDAEGLNWNTLYKLEL